MALSIAARLQPARILWGALLFTVVLYDLVLAQLHHQIAERPPVPLTNVIGISFIALMVAGLSITHPRKVLTATLSRMDFTVEEEGSRRVVVDPQGAVSKVLPAFQTSFILGMALADAVALFGFVLGFLGERMLVVGAFFLLSAALMGSKFPRVSTITAAIEKRTTAKCDL